MPFPPTCSRKKSKVLHLPVRQSKPPAIAVPGDPASDGAENQRGSKTYPYSKKGAGQGHWPGQPLAKNQERHPYFLHADLLDHRISSNHLRLHAKPGKYASWKNGFFHLSLRQPGPDLCHHIVCLPDVDRYGNPSRTDRYGVRPADHLDANFRNGYPVLHRLCSPLPDAARFGTMDGLSFLYYDLIKFQENQYGTYHKRCNRQLLILWPLEVPHNNHISSNCNGL